MAHQNIYRSPQSATREADFGRFLNFVFQDFLGGTFVYTPGGGGMQGRRTHFFRGAAKEAAMEGTESLPSWATGNDAGEGDEGHVPLVGKWARHDAFAVGAQLA